MNVFLGRDTPYVSQHLFDGELYLITSIRSKGAGATVYLQGKFSDRLFHVISRAHSFDGGGPFTVDVVEAPTITDGTTPVIARNMNRNSAKTHQAIFFSDPTAVSGGTVIETLLLPAGGVGSNTSGVGSTLGAERILKQNTDYVIRIANAGGASTFNTVVLFYESGN